MLGYEGGYKDNHTWNGNRLWGTDTSRMTKTSNGLDTQNSNNWLNPGAKVLTLMYDYDENRTNKLIHSDFSVSIIDKATGEYPTWLKTFREYGNGNNIGKNTINVLAEETGLDTIEDPMKAGIINWVIELKMNWLQDADTSDRVLEITFIHDETGESVTHTLTQDGSLAANKTPLNMLLHGRSAEVEGGGHSINLIFDSANTFASFRSPGMAGGLVDYYEGPISHPNFEVTLIDTTTGLEADWVSFKNIKYGFPYSDRKVACKINLEFEKNETGMLRYYDVHVTETNHNEAVSKLNMVQKQM